MILHRIIMSYGRAFQTLQYAIIFLDRSVNKLQSLCSVDPRDHQTQHARCFRDTRNIINCRLFTSCSVCRDIAKTFDPEESNTMAHPPKETQIRAYSETKLFEIHSRVSILAVPPEIIFPRDCLTKFATTGDSTDPLRGAMYGFKMTLQAAFVSKALAAFITKVARGATVLRTCSCLGQG